ncbi:hypothetical protein GCM10027088_55560 [Nocardia goodfellowii]
MIRPRPVTPLPTLRLHTGTLLPLLLVRPLLPGPGLPGRVRTGGLAARLANERLVRRLVEHAGAAVFAGGGLVADGGVLTGGRCGVRLAGERLVRRLVEHAGVAAFARSGLITDRRTQPSRGCGVSPWSRLPVQGLPGRLVDDMTARSGLLTRRKSLRRETIHVTGLPGGRLVEKARVAAFTGRMLVADRRTLITRCEGARGAGLSAAGRLVVETRVAPLARIGLTRCARCEGIQVTGASAGRLVVETRAAAFGRDRGRCGSVRLAWLSTAVRLVVEAWVAALAGGGVASCVRCERIRVAEASTA